MIWLNGLIINQNDDDDKFLAVLQKAELQADIDKCPSSKVTKRNKME